MKGKYIFIIGLFVGLCCAGQSFGLERTAVVIGSRVQMHEIPAGDSPVVGLVNESATVTIIQRQERPVSVSGFDDYWYRVNYRGKNGWVFGQFILPSSGGRGLAALYTRDEAEKYCLLALANLAALKEAKQAAVLMDAASTLVAEIKEMTDDPVLSAFTAVLEPYRLYATWYLAAGRAGTGDIKGAQKIRDQLRACDPGIVLPGKTTLGLKTDELDILIREAGGSSPNP
jgi:hypothetical protein